MNIGLYLTLINTNMLPICSKLVLICLFNSWLEDKIPHKDILEDKIPHKSWFFSSGKKYPLSDLCDICFNTQILVDTNPKTFINKSSYYDDNLIIRY